jgi:DNA-binding Xre family transcriptional regulator
MASITWRVAELAAARGWNTRGLAQATGLDVKTVRNILAGRATRVDLETIARLSRTLEVSPGALWRSQPDRGDAWAKAAGAAGQADPGELAALLAGDERPEHVDPGLERALRPS